MTLGAKTQGKDPPLAGTPSSCNFTRLAASVPMKSGVATSSMYSQPRWVEASSYRAALRRAFSLPVTQG